MKYFRVIQAGDFSWPGQTRKSGLSVMEMGVPGQVRIYSNRLIVVVTLTLISNFNRHSRSVYQRGTLFCLD